jgi:hypothetical protein
MSADRMGLFDLVVAARHSFTGRVDVLGREGEPLDVTRVLDALLDAIEHAARHGRYFLAARLASWWNHRLQDSFPEGVGRFLDGLDSPLTLEDSPNWDAFAHACSLADRIDSLLAPLERGPGAPVARGCRDDLDALPVLADWCDDHALPCAAREARHLHALARALRASLGDCPLTLAVEVDPDFEDYDSEME